MKRKEVAEVVLEFIQVAIHYLLFIRSIYPEILFERVKKYGLTS
jgi:hypothetical protein